MRNGTVPGNWEKIVEENSDLAMQENFTLAKEWHLNKSSSMLLPREVCQEDSLDPGPQDMPQGSEPRDAPSIVTEDPTLAQGTEARSDNSIPSNGYVSL